nr:uncharacterized protein LOC117989776 [Maniola hyperantus]XP_034840342.1 uncharacterized protein LOC117996393 [Maniola hyperantus]
MPLSNKVINNFKNISLADPSFYKPGPIDMLIAGDLFPYIYDGKRILPQESGMPVALHSIFGYVLAGQTVLSQPSRQSVPSSVQLGNQKHTHVEYVKTGQTVLSQPLSQSVPSSVQLGHQKHSHVEYVKTGQTMLPQHASQSVPSSVQLEHETSTFSAICGVSTHIDKIMNSFWELENIPTEIPPNPDDVLAEQLFAQEHQRDSNGRYIVKYPLRPGYELGDSRQIAIRRLLNLESKLERENDLKVEYHKFMSEYESLGHMTCLGSLQDVDSTYVIPHFCIVKPSSTTTSHRVVFDASCKTSNLNSLNSVVLPGPKLQADLNELIINFRLKEICLSADICKMYRQILIEQSQRPYQHILWRVSQDQPIKVYELNTVTYGVASSPYLAIKVLHTLADEEAATYPQAAQALKKAFFMDDFLWSVETVDEALQLQDDLIALLKRGGFLLRKWSSNSLPVLEHLPDDHRETPLSFDDDKSFAIKVLGLQWSPASDSFTFSTVPPNPVVTKRTILSQIGRQFDPLGYVAPCIFYAKCLMQQLWSLQLGWDEPLPADLEAQWQTYVSELHLLSQFKHERHAVLKKHIQLQVVGFCDASSRGYAAVVYLRTENTDTKISLLIAKSKVAPLKTVSIPRLELMAAHLLSKLIKYVYSMLVTRQQVSEILLFTDSSVVLNWLNTPSHTLKTFVATRVAKINDAVPSSCWNHVSGDSNPADVCSRGALPSTLLEMPEWLSGPQWLYENRSTWPIKSIEEFRDENPPELKPSPAFVLEKMEAGLPPFATTTAKVAYQKFKYENR